MPTGTFFRLPEEKKTRLIDAAWKEFTRTKFSDTSISRIIQEAGIPRGSFYQYFADKEDVLEYLLNDIRDYFIQMVMDAMQTTDGDLFNMPVAHMYSRWFKILLSTASKRRARGTMSSRAVWRWWEARSPRRKWQTASIVSMFLWIPTPCLNK